MKNILLFLIGMVSCINTSYGQVGIGTLAPDASSMLEVKSTTKGILIPRMSAAQRDALVAPANGLMVFVNDDNTFYFYTGSTWANVVSSIKSDNDWTISGSNMYSAVSGNVGIGTTTPAQQLEITQSMKMPETTNNNTGIFFKGDVPFLHNFRSSTALGFNTFLGVNAGNLVMPTGSNWQGSNNTGLGFQALYGITLGYANTATGAYVLQANTTGAENTAMGLQSLYANLGGSRNTALGYMASHENTSGVNNISLGYNANYYNQTGGNNTIIGYEAGKGSSLHNKSGNIFLGYQAGFNETGSNKLYIENSNSSSPLIGGDFSTDIAYINGKLGIGTSAPTASLHVAGTMRIADGTQAAGRVLLSDVNGTVSWNDPSVINDNDWTINGINMYSAVSGNVGIGTSSPGQQFEITAAMKMPATTNSTTGVIYKGAVAFIHDYKGPIALGYNTFIGQDAGNFTMGGGSDYLGSNNTGMGYDALHGVTNGYANTGLGAFSLSSTTTGVENTAVGLNTMVANIGGSRNAALGYMAGHENVGGNNNTTIGYNTNYYNQAGGNNTIIGFEAGKGTALHNKSGNVFLGYQAGFNETGSNKLYIENSNSSSPLIGGDFSTDIAYINGKLGIGTTNPAQQLELTQSLQLPPTTSGTLGVIYKGTDRFIHNYYTSGHAGNNTFVGVLSGNFTMTGSNYDDGSHNTAVGYNSLTANTSGSRNTAVGRLSLYTNSSGAYNTALGSACLYNNTSGQENTAVGESALNAITTGSYNSAVGYLAGPGSSYPALNYTSSIGTMTYATADYQIRIGNELNTSIGGFVGWTNLSDGRFKDNIEENVKGLDFIMRLRPLTYNLNVEKIASYVGKEMNKNPYSTSVPKIDDIITKGRSEKSKIRYTGFVAQEVEQAARATGFDFSGVDPPKNDNDFYGLRYAEFVVPLVKAIQEQQAVIEVLLKRIEELERKVK